MSFTFFGARRIAHDLFQRLQIIEVAPSARGCDPADCLRPVAIVYANDLHHLCFFQHAQVAAQISVCQCSQLLQIVETYSLGIRNQGGEHA